MTPERRDDPHGAVQIMGEAKGLLIGLAAAGAVLVLLGLVWKLTHP